MAFYIGPLQINLYGIMLAIGVLAAMTVAYFEA
jgi:prolipoprotein diacylglyceryltransferase